MSDNLDLHVIERLHDADPNFREALRKCVEAILDGSGAIRCTAFRRHSKPAARADGQELQRRHPGVERRISNVVFRALVSDARRRRT